MKHRFLTIAGTILISLLIVSMAYAYAATTVDGLWGTIDDGEGATNDSWGTGDGDNPDYTTNYSSQRVITQNQIYLDENQVRYGEPAYEDNEFGYRSGFGFDGSNNVGTVPINTPFYLGEFTHYNNPIYAENTFNNTYLDVTVSGIQCLEGGAPLEGSTLSFTYLFELEETSNTAGECEYTGTTVCPDRVTITNVPLSAKFTCPEGDYTVQILGFADSPNNQNNGCIGSTYPGTSSGYFITEESQDNYACLWAQITDWVPTAVELAEFNAAEQTNAVLLNWSSASELSIMGYNLYRSTDQMLVGTQINTEMIPAKNPGQLEGAFYEFLDDTALFGQTYFYTLQVIYSDNSTQWSDQVTAIPSGYKIFAPILLKP